MSEENSFDCPITGKLITNKEEFLESAQVMAKVIVHSFEDDEKDGELICPLVLLGQACDIVAQSIRATLDDADKTTEENT